MAKPHFIKYTKAFTKENKENINYVYIIRSIPDFSTSPTRKQ